MMMTWPIHHGLRKGGSTNGWGCHNGHFQYWMVADAGRDSDSGKWEEREGRDRTD